MAVYAGRQSDVISQFGEEVRGDAEIRVSPIGHWGPCRRHRGHSDKGPSVADSRKPLTSRSKKDQSFVWLYSRLVYMTMVDHEWSGTEEGDYAKSPSGHIQFMGVWFVPFIWYV